MDPVSPSLPPVWGVFVETSHCLLCPTARLLVDVKTTAKPSSAAPNDPVWEAAVPVNTVGPNVVRRRQFIDMAMRGPTHVDREPPVQAREQTKCT